MSQSPGGRTHAEKAAAAYRSSNPWYLLFVLTLISVCHSIDRGMPNILVEPIRHEFGLSDQQLGFFTGLSFAATFALAVLPMGYLSDRVNRRNLLAGLVLVWSVCTAICGLARNYVHLVLARMGVGAAESGAVPISLPMISESFPPQRRNMVLGLYYSSAAIGTLISSIGGAFIAAHYGWRTAFFVAGVPGIFLALLLLLTISASRPKSHDKADSPVPAQPKPKITEAISLVMRSPGHLALIFSAAFTAMVTISIAAWTGSFFIRVHHLTLPQVGLLLGIANAFSGVIGPPLTGWLGDRIGARRVGGALVLMAGALTVALVTGIAMVFTQSLVAAIALLFLHDIFRAGNPAVCSAALLDKTPQRLHGTIMSVNQLVAVVLGYGMGPILVGTLSDAFGGGTAIAGAIGVAVALLFPAALLLLIAFKILYPAVRTPEAS
ncbi:MAG: major facilitator superfamily protein [Caulobacteraceae bacterium]|nr:major facilitator superfamily protein [Caulobacteraceae bacterium]